MAQLHAGRTATAIRKVGIAFLVLAMSPCLAGCISAEEKRWREWAADIESWRDHFRVVGEVEINGERIVYDEVIQVWVDVGRISVMGLKKGDNRVFVSRRRIVRTLKDGSVLFMETPNGAGLFTDLERTDRPRDPKWTETYVKEYLRPPPEYLPEFYWMDSADAPTRLEAYIAETYYANPRARLRIVKPIRIEFVPRTPEAERIAFEQMEANPRVNLWEEGELSYVWQGLKARRVPSDVWTQIPDFMLTKEQKTSAVPIALTSEQSKILGEYAHHTMLWRDQMGRAFGVPQPRRFPDESEGMLYQAPGSFSARPEETLPVECNFATGICRIRPQEQGYYIFYRRRIATEDLKFEIEGHRLGAPFSAIYVPESGSIYLVRWEAFH